MIHIKSLLAAYNIALGCLETEDHVTGLKLIAEIHFTLTGMPM